MQITQLADRSRVGSMACLFYFQDRGFRAWQNPALGQIEQGSTGLHLSSSSRDLTIDLCPHSELGAPIRMYDFWAAFNPAPTCSCEG